MSVDIYNLIKFLIYYLKNRFEKELKNKILQKMVPNQSEDKILAKYFKHFDLDNIGITLL